MLNVLTEKEIEATASRPVASDAEFKRLESLDRGARADTRAEVVFKCWNAWRRGDNISSVKVSGKLPKLEK